METKQAVAIAFSEARRAGAKILKNLRRKKVSDKRTYRSCDKGQQWLLPWWWEQYSAHNSYPVVFVDFGLSEKGIACAKRGGSAYLYQTPG